MSHPDGEIALCNDAAFRIAPAPALLLDYGRRLGCSWPTPGCCAHLAASGYVVRRDRGHYIVIDIGPLGPDHQLAHAHCDLFSLNGQWPRNVLSVIRVSMRTRIGLCAPVRATRPITLCALMVRTRARCGKSFALPAEPTLR